MTAEYKVLGDVAVITMNNPPVNGLGYATRIGITQGLGQANADDAVKAIVITGAGKAFSGGADIKEFGSPKATAGAQPAVRHPRARTRPSPSSRRSTRCAMGGGLELSLGCHYRIAAPGANIALPEVKLGLIPGAGGTHAPAARAGRRNRAEHDRQRRAGQERTARAAARPEAVRQDGVLARVADGRGDRLRPSVAATRGRCRWCATCRASTRMGDAYFQFARNMVKGMAKNFPAPPSAWTPSKPPPRRSSTKAWPTSARSSPR
jgi:3-hydroxyacyl-CoA dehydrogenase